MFRNVNTFRPAVTTMQRRWGSNHAAPSIEGAIQYPKIDQAALAQKEWNDSGRRVLYLAPAWCVIFTNVSEKVVTYMRKNRA